MSGICGIFGMSSKSSKSSKCEPLVILVNNPHRRVYEIPLEDSNEVIVQRYMVSILPVKTREGREALMYMKQDLIKAIENARTAQMTNIVRMLWEESDYDGYGPVTEDIAFRTDEDLVDDDVDDDVENA